MTNAKVELGRGLKVLHHDVGYGFAEVLLLAFMVPRHENLLFAVGSLWYPGLGNRCTEHLQQIASGEAGVYREGIFYLLKRVILGGFATASAKTVGQF